MESKVKRTLVKSAPELWELASDMGRMEAWTAGLIGSERAIPVEVTVSKVESMLAWRSADPGSYARIAIELSESGFGTAVEITAQHARSESADADAALEHVLDELGSPERRPFARA
jgi:hypothetical protein